MTDADLVKDFRNGNREAFSTLVDRHSRPLTMMILKMVRDPEEARDISQTTFLKAYENLSGFMMASSFKTWLYRIAINTIRDNARKHRPIPMDDPPEDVPSPQRSQAEEFEARFTRQALRDAMKKLPEKQRMTLQLRVYEDMDYKEIARVLGGTEGAARGNFFQAVKKLKEMLGSEP